MTEERLKEIKDSIDFQLDIAKINKLDGVINCLIEEQELYDEVITLKEENEILKEDFKIIKELQMRANEELNKHIKEGIEKDAEIKEQNDDIEWWTNRFNAVERDNRELNNIIKEVREYIETNSYFESNMVKTMVLKDYSNGILEIIDKGE